MSAGDRREQYETLLEKVNGLIDDEHTPGDERKKLKHVQNMLGALRKTSVSAEQAESDAQKNKWNAELMRAKQKLVLLEKKDQPSGQEQRQIGKLQRIIHRREYELGMRKDEPPPLNIFTGFADDLN